MTNFKSTVFKALGDPSRLKILDLLRKGERCACEIVPAVGFSQPTVSRQLKVLLDCGVLRRRKEGNKVFYSVTSHTIYELIDSVNSTLVESLSRTIMTRIQRGYR